MRVTERERKQYLNQIEKSLICKGNQRKQFLNSFEDNMDEYLRDNPDADFAQLEKDMGTPQEIANAFLENEDASKIKKRMNFKKWIIVAIIIIILMAAVTLLLSLIDSYKARRGYVEDTITEHVENEDGIIEEVVVDEYTVTN